MRVCALRSRAGCLCLASQLLVNTALAGAPVAPEPTSPARTPGEPARTPLVSPGAEQPAGPLQGDVSAQLREANQRYLRAVDLYDDGAYDAALHELERVYTLAPMFRVLYNLGIVCLALRDYARAMTFFERYLEQGGTTIAAGVRADVTDTLRALAERVAFVSITVNVAGAEVTIDDRMVGISPLHAPVRVNAGSRRVTAQAQGRLPESRVVGLAGGDEAIVALNLVDPTERPPATADNGRPFPWAAWVSTAALAGAATICAARAFALQGRYDRKQNELGVTRAELDDIDQQAFAFGVAADTLALASLAGAGYSLYLTFWAAPSAPHLSEPATASALSLDLGLWHARLTGSF